MGVTLSDRTILVNLPHYRGEGKGQCFFLRYKCLQASGLGYAQREIINARFVGDLRISGKTFIKGGDSSLRSE